MNERNTNVWNYVRGSTFRLERVDEQRRRVWDYFYCYLFPTPHSLPHTQSIRRLRNRDLQLGVAALIFAILALAGLSLGSSPLTLTGVLLLAACGAWIALDMRRASALRGELASLLGQIPPSPQDADIVHLIKTDMERLSESAQQQVAISDAELIEPPVVIASPAVLQPEALLEGASADLKTIMQTMRPGATDGIVRFAAYFYQFIYLTEEQISAYGCLFDHLTGKKHTELSHEFFYDDVVSVAVTREESDAKLPGGASLGWTSVLRLTVSSGDALRVTLVDDTAANKIERAFMQTLAPEYHARGVRFPAKTRVPRNDLESAVGLLRTHLRRRRSESRRLEMPADSAGPGPGSVAVELTAAADDSASPAPLTRDTTTQNPETP